MHLLPAVHALLRFAHRTVWLAASSLTGRTVAESMAEPVTGIVIVANVSRSSVDSDRNDIGIVFPLMVDIQF